MRILLINKFLHPNGGSETYMFQLGKTLVAMGHEVQFFGMDHEGRCVGNRINSYTREMDFHNGSLIAKAFYPIQTIYSFEARKKLRLVLDDFQPDICHLNNFNYQLTPSIIMEIELWKKINKKAIGIVYTAHDYQLVCPNHMCYRPSNNENCERCLNGNFQNCLKGRCIHNSLFKSVIGMMEGYYWKYRRVYASIDRVICCSNFIKQKLETNPLFQAKTLVLHNFVNQSERDFAMMVEKKDYILYFGRFSEEKGIDLLCEAAKQLDYIPFVFAGSGPLEQDISAVSNVKNVGFQSGEALKKLISEALFTIYPSNWYENCPLSVMESMQLGTPVIGANIGGIPELIKDGINGKLFTAGDLDSLVGAINQLHQDRSLLQQYSEACLKTSFDSANDYCNKILGIYKEILA